MILRLVAVAVGLAVLAATAHVTIITAGGYQSPHAVLTIAIAAGVGVGALAIGACWSERRRALALGIAVALLSGELFGLAMTAERLIAQRDQAQAPARKAADDRVAIAAELRRLESELTGIGTSSPRLAAALEAQRKVAETVAAKASERNCAANCRHLLEEQVRIASTEVDAARAAVAGRRSGIETSIGAEKARLARMEAPASGTPLADRLGLASWMLDLIVAALGAIGANGLAATLLAFGAHRPRRIAVVSAAPPVAAAKAMPLAEPPLPAPAPRMIDVTPSPQRTPVTDAKQHAARFGLERLQPSPSGRTSLEALHKEYRAWCAEIGAEELPPAKIAGALAELFAGAGIAIEQHGLKRLAVGVAIKRRRTVVSAAA